MLGSRSRRQPQLPHEGKGRRYRALRCLTNPYKGELEVTERHKAPTRDSGQGHGLSHFLRLLFRFLDEHQIRYCVLHSWQGLPDDLPSALSEIALRRSFPRRRESSPTATGLDPRLRGGDNHGDFHLLGWAAGP
jgi:hypothetical protein